MFRDIGCDLRFYSTINAALLSFINLPVISCHRHVEDVPTRPTHHSLIEAFSLSGLTPSRRQLVGCLPTTWARPMVAELSWIAHSILKSCQSCRFRFG